MLGERIRKLRKQKKLTLEELAGTELTKGMLSLIENNKANPSIESLTFIAKQLEVEVSDLLDEVNVQELRALLNKAEKIYNVKNEVNPKKYKELINLIEPHASSLVQGYEAARLLELYSLSLFVEKQSHWEEHCDLAAKLYDQMNIIPRRAAIGLLRSNTKFTQHDYEAALDILLRERNEIESRSVYIDPITRLDFDYNEAILHFAVGNTDDAKRVMDNAILFSKQNRTFYLIDDLYRLATAYALMAGDKEAYEFYLEKLRQYADFAEDTQAIIGYQIFYIESLNSVKHDYRLALEQVNQYLEHPDMDELLRPWLWLEKAKALQGLGYYQEAIELFDKIEVPPFHHHPFDLSQFYLKETYKALCCVELGKFEDALSSAKKAVELFSTLPDSPYKIYSLETYSKIQEQS